MIGFHRLTTNWYRLNKRDLPWRNTTDPYFIWLSEIILQQTRVVQGMEYYLKFTRNYPTVIDLANASEQDVLNDWQGLGYYSRARNLHATAKIIAFELNGVFPDTFDAIKKLKGIGDYTAAAISSFAFDLPFSVVDGNVYRVLSRVFDCSLPIDSTEGKKYFAQLAQELIDVNHPAIHNQAIMELGAIQCLPANPLCDSCPLEGMCMARINKTINERPVKEKKTKVRNRYFHFLIFRENEKIILQKRNAKDIWQHLYQFPLIETETEMTMEKMNPLFVSELGVSPYDFSQTIVHILSHQKLHAQFYFFDCFPAKMKSTDVVIDSADIQNYPLPRLIDRFLETNQL